MRKLKIKKLSDDARLPESTRKGDAGYDLSSTISCDIAPFERLLIPTGISLAIPEGYAGLIVPRSGLAIKHGISIVNSPGLIDSNYRGEICVVLINLDNDSTYHVSIGDRIAQLVLIKIESPMIETCDELEESNRGIQGFGSSGY